MLLLYVFLSSLFSVQSLNILGLFPHPGKSHHLVFEPLLVELVGRGHNLTAVSHFAPPEQYKGWTHISMGAFASLQKENVDLSLFEKKPYGMDKVHRLLSIQIIMDLANFMCDELTKLPRIQEMIINQEKFDVILVEEFNSNCGAGVAHLLNAPVVALQSHALMPWSVRRYGYPNFPSYMPCIFLEYGPHMSFLERVENSLMDALFNVMFNYRVFGPERAIIQRNLNINIPPLNEIVMNTSALLTNTHFTFHGSRPLTPGIVEVSGIHIRHQNKPLEQVLEIFMNASEHGVIVFSLGSLVQAKSMSDEKRNAFVEVFKKVKQNVVWKWEGDLIPNLSKNVLILKWLPQFDLLKHPKTVAFISHGGMLGTTEALYSGVPMLFIPVFGDQGSNAAAAVESGLGRLIKYADVTKENVYEELHQVLSPEMRKSALSLSEQWHERIPPLKVGADTVEYVAKYGGKLFRSAAQDLNGFQLYLIDVYLFLAAITACFLFFTYLWLKFLFQVFCKKHWSAENEQMGKHSYKHKLN